MTLLHQSAVQHAWGRQFAKQTELKPRAVNYEAANSRLL